jgi:NAD(P)-dependent dehydrogenase (short-subunit alcohol dehydrogenase family)
MLKICNAGVSSGSPLPFEFTTAEEDADLFAVNYFGVAETVRRFLPALRASRGRLLLVGSVAGNFATPLGQPYSASKFAVRSLGDSLRRELLPLGVAVARIEPGFIDTPILTKSGKGASQESLRFQQLSEANQRPYRDIHAKTSAALKGATGFAGTTADTDRDIAHAITAASPQAVYHPGTVKGFPAGIFVGAMWSLSAVWQDFVTSKF